MVKPRASDNSRPIFHRASRTHPCPMLLRHSLAPADNARLARLCGPLDEHLRAVEAEGFRPTAFFCAHDGLAVTVVSSGGTPSMMQAGDAPVATEYRPETYAYNDHSLVARGVCDWDDCALTVLATVVSALRIALPYADSYKHQIEQMLSQQLGADVVISQISAAWHQTGPALILQQVRINSGEQLQLEIAQTSVHIDFWQSLLARQFTAEHFENFATAGSTAQFMAATFDQQRTQAFKQRLMCLAETGQAEQTAERLTEVAHRLVRGDKRQARALHGLLAVQPPQTITQRQRFDLLQHTGKTVAHTIGLPQQTCATPDQFFEIVGRDAEADHLRIQRQLLWRALQQFQQRFRRTGTTQGLAQIGLAEGAGQQLQQAQVFIGFRGNANRQVDDLAVAPVHPFGELQQAHTGGKYLVAGFWRAMGNGDALSEKGRALGFTGLQAAEISLGDQAIGHQFFSEQVQGSRLIHSHLAHGNLLYSELKHAVLLVSARCALGIVLNKTV